MTACMMKMNNNGAKHIGPTGAAWNRLVEHLRLHLLQADALVDEGHDFLDHGGFGTRERRLCHLNNPYLGLRAGFEFHVDDLDFTARGDFDRQRVKRSRRRAIEHLAGRIVNAQVARAEKDLAEHFMLPPLVPAAQMRALARKGDIGMSFLFVQTGFPVASRNSISLPW